MHGAIYLYLKTTGDLQRRIQGWIWKAFWVFLALYLLTTIFTLVAVPLATRNFQTQPRAWGVAVLSAAAIANIPRAVHHGRPGYAFVVQPAPRRPKAGGRPDPTGGRHRVVVVAADHRAFEALREDDLTARGQGETEDGQR